MIFNYTWQYQLYLDNTWLRLMWCISRSNHEHRGFSVTTMLLATKTSLLTTINFNYVAFSSGLLRCNLRGFLWWNVLLVFGNYRRYMGYSDIYNEINWIKHKTEWRKLTVIVRKSVQDRKYLKILVNHSCFMSIAKPVNIFVTSL